MRVKFPRIWDYTATNVTELFFWASCTKFPWDYYLFIYFIRSTHCGTVRCRCISYSDDVRWAPPCLIKERGHWAHKSCIHVSGSFQVRVIWSDISEVVIGVWAPNNCTNMCVWVWFSGGVPCWEALIAPHLVWLDMDWGYRWSSVVQLRWIFAPKPNHVWHLHRILS